MKIKSAFINPSERRLRAGWRLLLQTILMLIIGLALAIPGTVLAVLFPQIELGLLPILMGEFLVITGSVFLARWLFDRRSITSLGLKLDRRALADLITGIGITCAMITLIFIVQWAAGWVNIQGYAWEKDRWPVVAGQTALVFLFFVGIGWSEELLSRGYHLQNLVAGLNLAWGVLLSSAIFGLLHLSNPHATWLGAAGIFLAGVFMATAYLRTRQLWLSIGIHIGWNFCLGVVFGFPVSGLDTYRLLRIAVDGPALWTGGAFGPEAGLVILPGLLLGFGLVFAYTRDRCQVIDDLEKLPATGQSSSRQLHTGG